MQNVRQAIGPPVARRETNAQRPKRKAHRVKRGESEVSVEVSLPDKKEAQGGNIGDYSEGHKENTQKRQGSNTQSDYGLFEP